MTAAPDLLTAIGLCNQKPHNVYESVKIREYFDETETEIQTVSSIDEASSLNLVCYQCPVSLTWFNFNPSMDK